MIRKEPTLVVVDQRITLLERLMAKKKRDLKVEWSKLKVYSDKTVTFKISLQDKNINKLRHSNVPCIDRSRIILKDSKEDFINANKVVLDDQVFIATQGCLETTVLDFWNMVWQEDIKKIVMLCKVKESDEEKCHQYWPRYDHLDVKEVFSIFVEERQTNIVGHEDKVVVTTLLLQNNLLNKSKVVIHYEVRTWPDHSAPKSNADLMYVYKNVTNGNFPLAVHCSAGIGRTGTFIAAYCCYEKFKKNLKFSVTDVIAKVRHQRSGAVQNFIQFVHVHLLMIELIIESNDQANLKQKLNELKSKFTNMLHHLIKKFEENQPQH